MRLRLVTFNAGLAVGVLPYATARVPHVARALAATDADILFLQEVWLDPHWDLIRESAAARFPHAFRAAPTTPAARGACAEDEVAPLAACAHASCDGLESDALGRCVIKNCMHTALSISTSCLNCIVTHPIGSIDEILDPCVGDAPSSSTSFGTEGIVAYGGSLGTAFLSALPLFDEDVLRFEGATLNARAALHVKVEVPDLGDVHVFGTHLSPGIVDEQRVQIDRLLAWVDEKAGAHGRVVVMGDLNTGPSVGRGAYAHSPGLYARFEQAGFVNAYAKRPDARCTFCHGSLTSGRHASSGWMLDHVLLRGIDAEATAERVLDEPLVVDVDGQRVETTYSDHCGVRVSVDA